LIEQIVRLRLPYSGDPRRCAGSTRYGCTPEFFEDIVRSARSSGARILPVAEALEALRAPTPAGLRHASSGVEGYSSRRVSFL
jgi:hypothetical protein